MNKLSLHGGTIAAAFSTPARPTSTRARQRHTADEAGKPMNNNYLTGLARRLDVTSATPQGPGPVPEPTARALTQGALTGLALRKPSR